MMKDFNYLSYFIAKEINTFQIIAIISKEQWVDTGIHVDNAPVHFIASSINVLHQTTRKLMAVEQAQKKHRPEAHRYL